jgi:hypothetical protein
MHKIVLLAAAGVAVASPAHASGGLLCRTAGPRPIEVSLVISHTAVPVVVSARLTDRGRAVPLSLAQAWIDRDELRLDLTDPNATRRELRLLAKANGRYYDGSIFRGGERRWVRCRED